MVITNDLDFSAILAGTSGPTPSVVQIRTQDLLSEATVSIVARALEAHGEEVGRGMLLSIDEGGLSLAESRQLGGQCMDARLDSGEGVAAGKIGDSFLRQPSAPPG